MILLCTFITVEEVKDFETCMILIKHKFNFILFFKILSLEMILKFQFIGKRSTQIFRPEYSETIFLNGTETETGLAF